MENGKKMEKMKNNGENSGPLTSLQVDRLTATDCNAAARAKRYNMIINNKYILNFKGSGQS